jgi:putative peptidoglycan lipid II flippase
MAQVRQSDAQLELPIPPHQPEVVVPLGLVGRLRGSFSAKGSTAFAATLLLMASSLLSGLLGLVRVRYIGVVFGAGTTTDAFNAAFQLPDMLSYFLVGGVGSISLIRILSRYREAGDDAGADRALSVVLNAMLVVLGIAVLLAEVLAGVYTRIFFPSFDAATTELCTHLTRILLPGQMFFFAGFVLGARLLVRKIFTYQALTPILYNLGIIVGGVLLAGRIGVDSLAWGALGGAFVGAALLNGIGALRGGLRYHPVLNLRDPAFLEWLKLSLPLMIGVSLTMADRWILNHYAAADHGGISLLTVAKNLFNAPFSIIGMAAGAASLPFFSSLFAQGRLYDFNGAVTRSVSRLLAVSFMVSAVMIALADPLMDLLFRRGRFTHGDAHAAAHYFAIFALTLCLWSAQGIYARAFYAAGDTLTPAVSGTVITLLSIPIYGLLYRRFGVIGLAVASDLGILALTITMAVQLHLKRLVSIASLEGGELWRAGLAAVVSYAGAALCATYLPHPRGYVGDLLLVGVAGTVWAGLVLGTLVKTRSRLPQQIRARR